MRDESPDGYRPDLVTVQFSGTSAGGYGVHYNYHYPLDEMRWKRTLAHPHAAIVIGGGVPPVDGLFALANSAWKSEPYLPPYCRNGDCSLSERMIPSHIDRLDPGEPYQRYLLSSAQHDNTQEGTQGFNQEPVTHRSDWINGVRRLYCNFRLLGMPKLSVFLPANDVPKHGFLNDDLIYDPADSEYQMLLADDVSVLDWLHATVTDPEHAVDRVEEGNLVNVVAGVKSFATLGCAVDGEEAQAP